MRISEESKGVYVIAATPFKDDGALDLASTDSMVDFYLDCGVEGMTILGVMGEAPKLTAEESVTFLSRVLDRVAGRAGVIVGVSNPRSEEHTSELQSLMRISYAVFCL